MVYFSNSFIVKLQIDDEHGHWTQQGMRNHPCCYLCCYLCCDWATKKRADCCSEGCAQWFHCVVDSWQNFSKLFVFCHSFPNRKSKIQQFICFHRKFSALYDAKKWRKNVFICLRAQHQAPSHTFSLKIERISTGNFPAKVWIVWKQARKRSYGALGATDRS